VLRVFYSGIRFACIAIFARFARIPGFAVPGRNRPAPMTLPQELPA
jgi:hypothetical protein